MLLIEKGNFRTPPEPRWGGTLCEMGQRALLIGGWGKTGVTNSDEHFVIDLEPELERNRRLEEEFEAKLEIDRVADETANYADMLSANYEKRPLGHVSGTFLPITLLLQYQLDLTLGRFILTWQSGAV